MSTNGFDHHYVETHDWKKAVAFWQRLGFELEFETDHGSGMLRHPAGGPTVDGATYASARKRARTARSFRSATSVA